MNVLLCASALAIVAFADEDAVRRETTDSMPPARASGLIDDARCFLTERFIDMQFDRSDWMANLDGHIANTKLVDMALPGTHNSATYSITSLLPTVYEAAVCQNSRLKYQLKGGVRYLDLRAANYAAVSGIRVGHGPAAGNLFESNLPQIAEFLETHPKEFVILDVGELYGYGLKGSQKTSVVNMLIQHFDQYMVKATDTWYQQDKVTMGQLWRNNKRILVLVDDSLLIRTQSFPDGNPDISPLTARRLGLWPKSWAIHGRWANTKNINDMYQVVSDDLKRADANRLHLSQLILTADVKQSVLYGGIEGLTKSLQDTNTLSTFVNQTGRMNIVSMDFIFGTTSWADFIVGKGTRNQQKQATLIDAIINRNKKTG